MSNNVQYVADRIALMDVMLKYAKGVDERDMALYRSVFADDVEIVGFGREEIYAARPRGLRSSKQRSRNTARRNTCSGRNSRP